jgi:hypothetical protein
MQMTRVLVAFEPTGAVTVRIDVDLTLLLGTPERYYELAQEPHDQQAQDIQRLLPKLLDAVRLLAGTERLQLRVRHFMVATSSRADFLDGSISKLSTFELEAALPAQREPLRLDVPIGAAIDYPIAYTVQVPAAQRSLTRWLEEGVHQSDPFDWSSLVPQGAAVTRGAEMPVATAAPFDPDALPWWRQLTLYLRLGFRHIVPEGADHILFVLGLFFLGVTWRKLLSQTTVFTIAHATTLFLSTYGIFRLPSRYVEPAIAVSIAVIALENVFRPRLGAQRLAIVFGFGLVHGLGFASSLSEVPFPKRDFLMALLGFNFGVDFGQLFVIALAFLAVGWFRHRVWFRSRIAIPCSLSIAAVGLFWAVQRALFYAHTGA